MTEKLVDMQPGWQNLLTVIDPELPDMITRWAIARRATITSVMVEVNQRRWPEEAIRVGLEDRTRDMVYSSVIIHRPADAQGSARKYPWMIDVGGGTYEVLF